MNHKYEEFSFLCLICVLLVALGVGCQKKQVYSSEQFEITINYPANWIFEQETEEWILLRTRSRQGTASIGIQAIESSEASLETLLSNRLDELVEHAADPDLPISYGETKHLNHENYAIVMRNATYYSKEEVTQFDLFYSLYVAAIQFDDRIAIVGAVGNGDAPEIAIHEIIQGLFFGSSTSSK